MVEIAFLLLLTTTILQQSEQCFFNILVPTLKNYITRAFHYRQYSFTDPNVFLKSLNESSKLGDGDVSA